jgi:hypothetical protein
VKNAAVLILGLTLILGSAAAGFGQDEQISKGGTSGAEFDFNSKYIWRSLAFSKGAVGQPSAFIGYAGLTFQIWSNFVLNRADPNLHRFNEIDYRLSYQYDIGDFTIAPAFTLYSYPNQSAGDIPITGEAEIQVAYALGALTLETTHFFDVWSNKGGYVGEVGLQFEKEAGAGLTLNAAARLIFANAKFNSYYIRAGTPGAINSLVLEAGATYAFRGGFYIRPHFEYNAILDSALRAAVEISDWVSLRKPDLFNFGIAIGFSFE